MPDSKLCNCDKPSNVFNGVCGICLIPLASVTRKPSGIQLGQNDREAVKFALSHFVFEDTPEDMSLRTMMEDAINLALYHVKRNSKG